MAARRIAAALLVVSSSAGPGCVDSSRAPVPSPSDTLTCAGPSPVPYPGQVAIPSGDTSPPGPYAWRNVIIKGGGFVTGIVMSPALPDLLFARTDVGGAYRFDSAARRWTPITDWAGHDDVNLTGIESIAVDPVDPTRVYIAAGQYLSAGNGWILASTDMGQTWSRHAIEAPMGGNADGRSMGERLAVDPHLPSALYFGSRNAGLFQSADFGQTWTRSTGFPAQPAAGYGLTFVAFDADSGAMGAPTPVAYVGVGVTSGTALYRTSDAGATWEAVPNQPAGLMPHHAVFDGCGNIYLAYDDGPGPAGPGKTANTVNNGAIWRYTAASDVWTDVSPPHRAGGFGGIAADPAHPGTLVVTTIDLWSPDQIFRTRDGGGSWAPIGSAAQRDANGATWLWFHGDGLSATGWMGDIEVDPFDSGRALYVTGQGIWSTEDLGSADAGTPTHWVFSDDGLEETVVLDLASPPAGPPLLSAVGDIAGFRHDDLGVSPPDGMFGSPIFSTTSSLDFAESAPEVVVRVGTSSASGGPAGAYSTDGGRTWAAFAKAPAGSAGSGSIAVSADGKTFLWAPRGNMSMPATPSYSQDNGTTWVPSTGLPAGAYVAADRVNPAKFYAGARARMYFSADGGATFAQASASGGARPRPLFGSEGDVWVAGPGGGLLHSRDSGASYLPVVNVNGATAVGFGAAAPGQSTPSVYLAGSVGGVWGVYRSDDAGSNWQRIDDPQHQFGSINVLAGDPRRYGRVYLGTGGRGIVYGDPR